MTPSPGPWLRAHSTAQRQANGSGPVHSDSAASYAIVGTSPLGGFHRQLLTDREDHRDGPVARLSPCSTTRPVLINKCGLPASAALAGR
jgi:hypothetical protein